MFSKIRDPISRPFLLTYIHIDLVQFFLSDESSDNPFKFQALQPYTRRVWELGWKCIGRN